MASTSSERSPPRCEKQRTELVGMYHFAEELAREGFIPLLTTRNIKGIDMTVSNANGSRSLTFQVKTITLENERNDSFPVFSTPGDDAKNHVVDAPDLFSRIRDGISPSPNKWWVFVPVENTRVNRYYVAPSEWVYRTALEKAKDYLGLNCGDKITQTAKSGKKKGELLTWGSLGVIGFYLDELKRFEDDIQSVRNVLVDPQ